MMLLPGQGPPQDPTSLSKDLLKLKKGALFASFLIPTKPSYVAAKEG